MLWLESFSFPDEDRENDYRVRAVKRTCYDTMYPFGILSARGLARIDFAPVTILYGGNGSGKSTALNVIAQKLSLLRDSRYNRSDFYEAYLRMCSADAPRTIPGESRVVTSDDVFDYMLGIRALNEGVDERREEVFREYLQDKYSRFRLRTMEDYDRLKRVCLAQSKTQSKYTRERLAKNVREQSNGESAFFFFTSRISDSGGLFLLDEPENSLSPDNQLKLQRFLEDGARFYDCQFIIATHSPFLLAMRGAKVIDLDASPARVRRWTELPSVRACRDFFKAHEGEFED